MAHSLFAKVIGMPFVFENRLELGLGDGQPEVRPGRTAGDRLRRKSARNQSGIDPNLGTEANRSARVNAFLTQYQCSFNNPEFFIRLDKGFNQMKTSSSCVSSLEMSPGG